ncbi:hypothetical protein MCB86_08830 [Pseudomonas sp. KSR10]|uniref:DUF6651 domain-containing protein n=1 Tax=Pseudomonas sp. KSR10 TaxID=2916654 RepID=UPI001EF82D50|nr:DUF6651 domain-containing protein [Pseudomonas sp. KSR10]MCG6540179.1 hypothetical protein [Pseudomonas sp. KSR10]
MKLKLDENGNAVLQDGKPVYVHDDGKEVAFDAPATVATITRLNAEAKTHREGKEAAEKLLKGFDGIEDPAAARKALETLANLDAKKLVDAGEIEKVKSEISKAFQAQLDEANGKAQTLEQQLYGEKIGGSFARSKVIAEKLAVPADMVQATFGSCFKIEEGKVVAYDANGNKIFSRARPGELADFDEALETLVDSYPHKDHILKGSGANGGGAPTGGGKQTPQKGNLGGTREERLAAIKARTENA